MSNSAVCLADKLVDVGQQWESETLRVGPLPILLRCIERDADDRRVQCLELGGSGTEPLTLDASPLCGCGREPPHHDPLPPPLPKREGAQILVGKNEVGRLHSLWGRLRGHGRDLTASAGTPDSSNRLG